MTPEGGRHLRRIATHGMLIAFGVLLAMGIGELAVRASWTPTVAPVYLPPRDDLPIIEGIFGLTRPNVSGIYRGVYYRSNSAGLRGPEYAPHPAPGVFRIAIFGDSFTMGDGVLEEQAYPHVLQRKLRRRYDQAFEVLNWGLAGVNTQQAVLRAASLAPHFNPDLLVYGFTVNDIEGEQYRHSAEIETQIAQQVRYLRYSYSPSYLLRFAWPRLLSLQELFSPARGGYLNELLDNYLNNPAAWRDLEGALDELAAESKRLDTPVVVFIHTTLIYLNRLHPLRFAYSRLAEAAQERGLPTIHSLEHFHGQRAEELWVNEVDPHPNDLGHEILAQALLDGLAEMPEAPPELRESPRRRYAPSTAETTRPPE